MSLFSIVLVIKENTAGIDATDYLNHFNRSS
jgi:hypothetical protein